MRGKFITLEGIDGAGKSSHVQWLAERLRGQGHEVVVTREPGGTPLGEKLRELILHEPMALGTETLLVFAARQEHLAQVILPGLEAGRWILSDRFTDATFAYQGVGRRLGADRVAVLEAWVHGGFEPDLTVYFDVAPEVGRARRDAARDASDRFEREDDEFHARVRRGYLDRAAANPGRFRVIDGGQPLAEVRKQLEVVFPSH